MKNAFIFLLTTATLMVPAFAQVTGPAEGLPEASVNLQGRVYRLSGVTGLPLHQNCLVDGKLWGCGVAATRALQTLLGGTTISCIPPADAGSTAAYAMCTTPEGDVASLLAEEGWALAESDSYVADQQRAQDAAKGIWQGKFEEPGTFSTRMDAIEQRYAALTTDRLVDEAGAVLADMQAWMPAFAESAQLSSGAVSNAETLEVSLPLEDFRQGFLLASIEPPAVFNWNDMVSVLASHRQAAVTEMVSAARDAVWASLNGEPAEQIETDDASSFYAALQVPSAEWIAQGKQPILLVSSASSPSWIGKWFSGQPPDGAELSKDEDITATSYVGTIDGIDVFVGNPTVNLALLTTGDKLATLAFSPGPGEDIVSIAQNEDGYTLGLDLQVGWGDAPLIALSFPEEQAGEVYGSP